MTLEEAKNSIGRNVVFTKSFCKEDVGVITSVNGKYVFVRFNNISSEACSPEYLKFEL